MKEKIERFSRGDFEYDLPILCLSEDIIKITVEAGKTITGSFVVSNSAGRRMKGILYSSHRLFTVENSTFCGTEVKLNYCFHATFLSAGDSLQGELTIVSDCGEQSLPFTVQVEAPYCSTSLGKIKDLFQFANLARMDWTEAKKVFRSEDFERVILRNDEKYSIIYHNLLKNISTSQALEEFLIAIHKKSKIELSIDKTSLSYTVSEYEFMDKLILTKNHWGYAEIRVSTDAPFIRLEQKFVWADRFIGNTHQISFLIVPKQMKPGNNYGRILIKTVYQTIIVEVVCKYHKQSEGSHQRSLPDRRRPYLITRNYLDLRMNKSTLNQYVEASEALMKETMQKEANLSRLMNIHLALVTGKNKAAGLLLGELQKEEVSIRKQSVVEYCAYLYLNTLYRKEEETIQNATDIIRRYYTSGHFDWRLLWFLLYTDKRYERNKNLKLNDIREQFDSGCHSPILYLEAVLVYEEEPYQLRELTDFEIQVFQFGIRNGIISKDTALQYTYLAGRRKNFHPVIYRCLVALYQKFGSVEILTAICCMLIKGFKKSTNYFEWYRLGVEAQLRITELYEYYMYSVDDTMETPIAQPVLLYFIYNSSLNDRKRAFLYANIIKNKEKLSSIYRTYYKKMEVFALKQLEAHNISPNLAVLYREFMDASSIRTEMALHLPYIIFTHELICSNPNMVSVSVNHRELEAEENQPLVEGRAYIQHYSQNTDIFLIDTFGNRYCVSVEYELKPLFPMEEQEYNSLDYLLHPMLQLHIYERYQSYRIENEQAISLRRQLLQISGLKEEYRTACLMTLIDYYYENYNEELLEQFLTQLDLSRVKDTERIRYLEYMVIRRHYDRAMEALSNFGFEGISVKRLVRMCSGWITFIGFEVQNDLLIALCFYIFNQGKYDEAILKYLTKHYQGPTESLLKLWKAAEGFEIENHELMERLLVQLLFTEGHMGDSLPVFMEYYHNITNRLMVRAFLTFQAYQYLVHDRMVGDELFSIMRRELNYEENDICLLAWMKYSSGSHEISDGDCEVISYHISRMEKKGIILPFFLEYHNKLKLPVRMSDKFYIEHKTNPRYQVYLHYRLLKNNYEPEFIVERMPDSFLGIHVKELILFCHEILEYYITEEDDGYVNTTDLIRVQNDRDASGEEETKYNQLNLILAARNMQDEKTLMDMMEHYVKSEYIISKIFKPMI